jgi:hypothetical protein
MNGSARPDADDSLSLSEICELVVIAALGWLAGHWVFKGLSGPLTLGAGLLALVLLWVTFGFGETLRQRILILGVGGGWFLLLGAGPLAGLNWLVLWVVPTASGDRLGLLLTALAVGVAGVLLLLRWLQPDASSS